MAELIHEDRSENAFYRSIGLTPACKLATYALSSAQVLPLYSKINRRFRNFHPLLVGTEIMAMEKLPADMVREFFIANFADIAELRMLQLKRGEFDLAMSPAAIRDGRILGIASLSV